MTIIEEMEFEPTLFDNMFIKKVKKMGFGNSVCYFSHNNEYVIFKNVQKFYGDWGYGHEGFLIYIEFPGCYLLVDHEKGLHPWNVLVSDLGALQELFPRMVFDRPHNPIRFLHWTISDNTRVLQELKYLEDRSFEEVLELYKALPQMKSREDYYSSR